MKDNNIVRFHFPLAWLSIVLLGTGLFMAGLTYALWNSSRDLRYFEGRNFRILELKGSITHLDEVLTMSARMAASTGDSQWEKRYLSFEPKLGRAIQEAISLAPEAYQGEGALRTNAANDKLVEMEHQSFDWIREGRPKEADDLLASPAYTAQKKIYTEGMNDFILNLSRDDLRHREAHRKREMAAMGAGAVVFAVLFATWWYVLRLVRRWRKTLLENYAQLTGKTAELAAVNHRLDLLVVEKTKKLNENKEHLELALSASGIGIWEWDIETDQIFGDQNTQKLFNNPTELLTFEDFIRAIHPRDRERVRKEIQLCLERETEYETSFQVLNPDGSTKFQAGKGKIYRNAKGKPVKMTGMIWDITRQKKAEEAVHQSEVNYRSMIENSADGILIIGQGEGDILFANCAAAKLFGQTPADLLGTEFGFPITSHKASEISLIPKQGKKCLVEFHVARTQWKERSAYVVSLRDITMRKELEMQLVQSQKMNAIGQLTGGIAHDFNNILTVINGYSEHILSNLLPENPLRPHLEEILKAGKRAKALTNQLLMFSRQQVITPRVIDLNALIVDLEKMARRMVTETVEFVITLSEDLGRVKVDPSQMEQLLMNLVVNAKDAMPQGGKVTIETRNVQIQEHEKFAEIPSGEYVLLVVSDNGSGMSLEVKEHLFEPFFTTKEIGQGAGLGLATCYGIVKQSGGAIRVSSEAGSGTSFEIYLPRSVEKPTLLISEKPSEDLPRGSETILLVEDESSVRKLAALVLTRQGYSVLEAENGEMGLRIAQEQKEKTLHLAIADVVMPHMGGREFAEQVLVFYPGIKILFVSGYTDDQVIRRGVEVAQTNFLQKPFSPKALAFKVREILDQKMDSILLAPAQSLDALPGKSR